MATIFNGPTIRLLETGPLLHSPILLEVAYTIRFTPMERLLVEYGLSIFEYIRFYEVDDPVADVDTDDFISWLEPREPIPSEEILSSPTNELTRVRQMRFDRSELRGPDDEETNTRMRQLRAHVIIGPSPSDPTEISSDSSFTNIIEVNTSEGGFEVATLP